MLKIIFAKERTVLHSLLIQNISTYSKLSQYACCPLTELSCTDAVHTITYANNSIEIVEHSFSFNMPITFHSNYFHFGNSSLFCEFPLLINVFKVLAYYYCCIDRYTTCSLSDAYGGNK